MSEFGEETVSNSEIREFNTATLERTENGNSLLGQQNIGNTHIRDGVGERHFPVQGGEGHITETVEDGDKVEASRREFLSWLESQNYFFYDDQGRVICHLDKFKQKQPDAFNWIRERLNIREFAMNPDFGNKGWPLNIYHAFKDLPIFSTDDYERLKNGEQIEPKPLFYSPRNAEAALSIDDIKNSKFHMGLWELGIIPQLPMEYPTLEGGNTSGLSIYEAITSCLIYHPQYGNGERSDEGALYVDFNEDFIKRSGEITDKERIRRPISGTFFDSWGYRGSPTPGRARADPALLESSPANFFMSKCPNMIEKGLINPPEDFSILSNKKYGPDIRSIQENGIVRVSGKSYSLGREFGKGNYSVYELSSKFVAILDNSEKDLPRIVKVFKINTDPISEDELRKPASSRSIIKKTEIEFFNPQELSGLDEEEGILVDNFADFIKFSQKIAHEGNINLMSLSLREKSLATAIYQKYQGDPRMWNFIRQYGLNGIRSMMAVEEAKDNVGLIWELGEKTDATRMFINAAAVMEAVGTYEDSIRNTLNEAEQRQADDVASTILKEMNNLLLSSIPIVHNDPGIRGKLFIADVDNSIQIFRQHVVEFYENHFQLKIMNDELDTFYQGVLDSYGEISNEYLKSLILARLRQTWEHQALVQGEESSRHAHDQSDKFYTEYSKQLFETANETTGDTQKELDHFKEYLRQRASQGRPVTGNVLDMGCGDGERITRPMADALKGKANVIGIDRLLPPTKPEGNMFFVQGDFTHIPLLKDSVDLVTAHWSVINDLASRPLQRESFKHLARVLKVGGEFYFDVPYLEGGEGSWEKTAKEYHKQHPNEAYGMIHGVFPNGLSKEFYIYPKNELNALFDDTGFSIQSQEVWRTDKGIPRMRMVVRLEREITPDRFEF